MSKFIKAKMAGRLSGSLKTATEDRLAKAEAVMASGGLLRPVEVAVAARLSPAAVPPNEVPAQAGQEATDITDPVAVQRRRMRVQRETFTMLPHESEKIDEVRTRAAANKVFTTRSAVIRAGVTALERLSDEQLLQVLGRLQVVKPGRRG